MKTRWFLLGSILIALLALATGLTLAQGPGQEGGAGAQGDVNIAATVSSKISYQGVLKENGQPVTGSRDMTFALYSDDNCTTQLGSEINATVPITNGVFSVELNFGPTYFDGRPVWLGVKVGTTRVGCQEILPVPYALSLRPGANIVGEMGGTSLFYVRNDSTSAYAHGIYGETKSHNLGAGVFGFADATTEHSYGVEGRNNSTTGTGVFGHAAASTGYTEGVYGLSNSTSGIGVIGRASADTGTTYGVYGTAQSPNGYGGYFRNSDGVALKAGGSGIIQSTAVSRIFVPGNSAVPHADSRNDLDFKRWGRGSVDVLRPAGSGDEQVLIPIPIPAVLYGQRVRVADLRVHYMTSDSATYIDKTYLYREKSDGGYYTLISSTTNRTSTTFTYYHLSCGADECRLGDEISYLTVVLHLHFANGSDYIKIGGVRITLEHD